MILPSYFENPEILHVNTEPHHAYFIPFAKNEKADQLSRETSSFSPHFQAVIGHLNIIAMHKIYLMIF